MEKLLSVVIPVYNVEKFLCECIDNVINQTYRTLQIIIIDDGSKDSSGDICDKYAEKDKRITVIHQKNAGAGAAKNIGLDLVKGDYFSIIDSDDYIELDMYENMVRFLEESDADIVQCLFRNVFVNGKIERKFNFPCEDNRVVKAKDFLYEMLYDWKYAIFANKLFKTSLLKDIRFPVGRKIDDEFFTYKLVCNAERVVITDSVFYNYRMRKTSVMNSNDNCVLITDRIDCFLERNEYIARFFPSLKDDYYYHFADFLLFTYNETSSDSLKHILKKYVEKYPLKNDSVFSKVKRKYKNRQLCIENEVAFDGFEYFD